MTVERQIRISDDDREQYNNVIKSAYADGRITDSELDDRLTAVLEARFEADLVPVVADLPNPPPVSPVPAPLPPPGPPDAVTSTPVAMGRSDHAAIGPALTPFLMAPVICTAIYAMTDLGGYFWPMWVWFGCSIPIVGSIVARRLGE